jgi:hypothetical protein
MTGLVSLRAALDVQEIELVPVMDQTALFASDIAARKRATTTANADDLATKAKEVAKDVGSGLVDIAKFAVVAVLVVGAGIYLLRDT